MNDFTFHELLTLRRLAINDLHLLREHSECLGLTRKLDEMIDNYEQDRKVKESMNYIIEKARQWKIEL